MFFSFPEDALWNADLQAVEFDVGVGEAPARHDRRRPLFA
jgi:hypothetical protein